MNDYQSSYKKVIFVTICLNVIVIRLIKLTARFQLQRKIWQINFAYVLDIFFLILYILNLVCFFKKKILPGLRHLFSDYNLFPLPILQLLTTVYRFLFTTCHM